MTDETETLLASARAFGPAVATATFDGAHWIYWQAYCVRLAVNQLTGRTQAGSDPGRHPGCSTSPDHALRPLLGAQSQRRRCQYY